MLRLTKKESFVYIFVSFSSHQMHLVEEMAETWLKDILQSALLLLIY